MYYTAARVSLLYMCSSTTQHSHNIEDEHTKPHPLIISKIYLARTTMYEKKNRLGSKCLGYGHEASAPKCGSLKTNKMSHLSRAAP